MMRRSSARTGTPSSPGVVWRPEGTRFLFWTFGPLGQRIAHIETHRPDTDLTFTPDGSYVRWNRLMAVPWCFWDMRAQQLVNIVYAEDVAFKGRTCRRRPHARDR